MIGEAPNFTQTQLDFAGKLAKLRRHSPLGAFHLLRRILYARWKLRGVTSLGNYVKLVGPARVVNDGTMTIGDRTLIYSHVATTELVTGKDGVLKIGEGTFLNYGVEICAYKQVELGEECRIGTHCIIMDNDFHH